MAAQIKKVSLNDLKKMWQYQRLLPAQKKYVEALIQSAEAEGTYNFIGAAAVAYPLCAKKPRSLAVRSSQLQSHPHIHQVLSLAFGEPQDADSDVLVTLVHALKKSIRKDMAERGVLSDATAKALQVWERKTGKRLVVSRGE